MRNVSSSGKQSVGEKDKGMKRGPWTPEEDQLLSSYINQNGEGQWRTLPGQAGLLRCGKSCRLRWMNYLRPSIKRGHIAPDEEDLILRLHRLLGNRWSLIAGRIPGRTDNEIKNYWNTYLSKKLISQGIDPTTHKPLESSTSTTQDPLYAAHHNNNINNIYTAYSSSSYSRLPADHLLDNSLNKITTTSVKNDQEYYYGGTKLDIDQFDLSTIAGSKAEGLLSNDDDDAFLSSLISYEQLFNQHEELADSSSHALAFVTVGREPSSQPGFPKHEP